MSGFATAEQFEAAFGQQQADTNTTLSDFNTAPVADKGNFANSFMRLDLLNVSGVMVRVGVASLPLILVCRKIFFVVERYSLKMKV